MRPNSLYEARIRFGNTNSLLSRRLDRWDKGTKPGVMGTNRAPPLKPIAVNGNGTRQANDDTEDEGPAGRTSKKDTNGDVHMEDEDLDDAEKEVLGLGSGDEDGAEDLDEVDKELLGIGGDDTEEEGSDGGMDVDG